MSARTETFTRGLDKNDEYAADRVGPVLAARAGYDPFGLAVVLQSLAEIKPGDNAIALMFQTHPAPEDRLERMLKVAEPVLQAYSDQARLAERFANSVALPHSKSK